MKFSRRQLLTGAAALAIAPHEKASAYLHPGATSGIPSGWQNLPIGGGGYVPGISIAADGNMVAKVDVLGAYYKEHGSTVWTPIVSSTTLASFGVTGASGTFGVGGGGADPGCWEIVIDPTNSSNVWMIWQTIVAGPPFSYTRNSYNLYRSTDKGQTWVDTGFSFTIGSEWAASIANSSMRGTNQKIAVDPNNSNVVYVSTPNHCTPTGVYVTRNGLSGSPSFTQITDIPSAPGRPGYAGICVDPAATTSVGGVTCSTRVLVGAASVGLFESTNGGVNFSKITSDATPSTTVSYTSVSANAVIVVYVMCYGLGYVTSVSNSAGDPSGALTWNFRGNNNSSTGQARCFCYYALAPTAGTYNITVTYADGGRDAFSASNSNNANEGYIASCTGATIPAGSGSDTARILTISGDLGTGSWAIGQYIRSTIGGAPYYNDVLTQGQINANICRIIDDHSTDPTLTGTGGNGTYRISTPAMALNSGNCYSSNPVANQVSVIAFANAAMTLASDNPFDANGPKYGLLDDYYSTDISIAFNTASTNTMPIIVGMTKRGTATPSPSAGYAIPISDHNNGMFVEVYGSVVAASGFAVVTGSQFNNGGEAGGLFRDAIRQGSGTLALDAGTPAFATSGPSNGDSGVTIINGALDQNGNYFFVSGGLARAQHSAWRYLKGGAIERLDGASTSEITGPNTTIFQAGYFGAGITSPAWIAPHPTSVGTMVCQGGVTSSGYACQTTNGTALPAYTITWVGTGARSSPKPVLSGSNPPWANQFTSISLCGLGLIDPTDGSYWVSNGSGVVRYSTFIFNLTGYSVLGSMIAAGMESTLVQDVFTTPGGSQLLVAAEDQMILFAQPPSYPSTRFDTAHDSNSYCFDYASSDPTFVVNYAYGSQSSVLASSSSSSGAQGSWAEFAAQPTASGQSSVAGMIVASTPSVLLAVRPGLVPQYSSNGGASWADSTGAPAAAYINSAESTSKPCGADRVNANTFYLYAPATGQGFYRSTDGGATFVKMSNTVLSTSTAAYTLMTTPGYGDDVWLARIYTGGNESLWRCRNAYSASAGNATWAAITGLTNVQLFGIGATYSGDNYPCIFVLATIGGTFGFYRGRSTDGGNTFSWTQFGDLRSIPPNASLQAPHGLCGDWNVPGKCYYLPFSAGAVEYSP